MRIEVKRYNNVPDYYGVQQVFEYHVRRVDDSALLTVRAASLYEAVRAYVRSEGCYGDGYTLEVMNEDRTTSHLFQLTKEEQPEESEVTND